MNYLDQCANTSLGAVVDETGCADSQLDTDGDGVVNSVDQCPNTPAGTTVDTDGCALDSDGDGVIDDEDAFPQDPSETTDTDGDGIGNNADPDDDNDGILDEDDRFPVGVVDCEETANTYPRGTVIINSADQIDAFSFERLQLHRGCSGNW